MSLPHLSLYSGGSRHPYSIDKIPLGHDFGSNSYPYYISNPQPLIFYLQIGVLIAFWALVFLDLMILFEAFPLCV